MSIRERRPGVWQIRAYAGIDAAGQAQYVYKTFSGTKSEARKEELKLRATAGVLPRGSAEAEITLTEYADRWLALYIKPTIRPRSVAIYRTTLDKMILPSLGSLKLKELKPEIIQRVFNELDYAPASKVKARTILSAMLKRARKSGLIANNPCEDLALPPIRFHHVRALTPEEASRFLQVCETYRDGLLFAAALLTGLRKSELLMLRWPNVDLDKGIIMVREGGSVAGETKSEAGRRDVVIPRYLLEKMKAAFLQDEEKHLSDSTWNSGRHVFPSIHGQYRPGGNVPGRNLRKALALAGIDLPGFRFHDLRHSHGSLLLEAGVPLPAIQGRLGHASLLTTVSTYLHADGRAEVKISDYLDSVAVRKSVH